jgi:hypothetical protein
MKYVHICKSHKFLLRDTGLSQPKYFDLILLRHLRAGLNQSRLWINNSSEETICKNFKACS